MSNYLDNPSLYTSTKETDYYNSQFYGKYTYPWPLSMYYLLEDKEFYYKFLNQDLGVWDNKKNHNFPNILVAGCGTNQAVLTAIRYPNSKVTGIDLSVKSLEVCQSSADICKIQNLSLRNISINELDYKNEFDLIICTGVIHHNYDPKEPLLKLKRALKEDGVMEIMVYNYYHRIQTVAFQRVMNKFGGDFLLKMNMAKELINQQNIDNSMGEFLKQYKDAHESRIADALFQPVEFTYVLDDFTKLLSSCELKIIAPCINQFDKEFGNISWNINFEESQIKKEYERLSDLERWSIGNYLLLEKSPMLWFYVGKKNNEVIFQTEQQICDEFLKREFRKSTVKAKLFFRDDNTFNAISDIVDYPKPDYPQGELARIVYDLVNPSISIEKIFDQLKLSKDFYTVNRIRNELTTSAFPYIVAI